MLVQWLLSALRDVQGAGTVAFVSVSSRCWYSGVCQRYRDVRGAGTVAFVSVRDDDDDEFVSFQMLTSH